MNRQNFKLINGIYHRAGIEWTHVPGYVAFTANPIRGCQHRCKWRMPDGTEVPCYAKTNAENGPAKRHYPGGFEQISFHPEVLDEIRAVKKPAAIFIDSMSDLFGSGVKTEWTEAVLQLAADCPQHLLQILTKNPTRLPSFDFPSNTWIGVSAPPTSMFGKTLTLAQQKVWYNKALASLGRCNAQVKWTSIEPLSWDVSPVIRRHYRTLSWAVVGAATNGALSYQPDKEVFKRTLTELIGIPVFFKGNLDRQLVDQIAGDWREEFPI